MSVYLHVLLVLEKTAPDSLEQCFSAAGPRPGTGPWH